jgi:RNA polymerase sigma factor (sigma-70 family)
MSDAILERYRGWLLKTARELAPRRPNDWLDLAQEGSIAMWRALKTFDESKGSEVSYLTTAARLRMTDCLRRNLWTGMPTVRGHTREEPATPVDINWEWVLEAAVQDFPLDRALWAYHNGEISRAISSLSAGQQRRVIDNFWRGVASGGISSATRQQLAEKLEHLR